jgi:hypothetical protein
LHSIKQSENIFHYATVAALVVASSLDVDNRALCLCTCVVLLNNNNNCDAAPSDLYASPNILLPSQVLPPSSQIQPIQQQPQPQLVPMQQTTTNTPTTQLLLQQQQGEPLSSVAPISTASATSTSSLPSAMAAVTRREREQVQCQFAHREIVDVVFNLKTASGDHPKVRIILVFEFDSFISC